MPERAVAIVVDASVAESAGIASGDRVAVIPGGRSRGGDADAIAEAVAASGECAVVLARPPWSDPAAAALAGITMLLGRQLVWLPPGLAEAGWAAALIAGWADDCGGADLVRRAQVAVGLAALPACRLPRRPWGCEGAPMPALVPASLARWCDRLWEACDRCSSGGGAPGSPCAHCAHGEPVA